MALALLLQTNLQIRDKSLRGDSPAQCGRVDSQTHWHCIIGANSPPCSASAARRN